MQSKTHRVVMILLGTFFMAVGTYYFLLPYHLSAGGVAGLAVIVNALHPAIAIGNFLIVANLALFVLGLIFLGREFGIYTFLGSMSFSLYTRLFEILSPNQLPLTSEPLISLVMGSVLMAGGISMVFLQNASTGGTDIPAKILNTYLNIDLVLAQFLCDGTVVLLSAIFMSMDISLHNLVAIMLQSVIMEYIIGGSGRKVVMNITTRQEDMVRTFITSRMERSCTLIQTWGGFSGVERRAIMTVVDRHEYIQIRQLVEEIDPTAFIFIYAANEVLGEGFTYQPEGKTKKGFFASRRSMLRSDEVVDDFIQEYQRKQAAAGQAEEEGEDHGNRTLL